MLRAWLHTHVLLQPCTQYPISICVPGIAVFGQSTVGVQGCSGCSPADSLSSATPPGSESSLDLSARRGHHCCRSWAGRAACCLQRQRMMLDNLSQYQSVRGLCSDSETFLLASPCDSCDSRTPQPALRMLRCKCRSPQRSFAVASQWFHSAFSPEAACTGQEGTSEALDAPFLPCS